MKRSRQTVIAKSTLQGSLRGGVNRGQAYMTLKSVKSIKPYDTVTANALFTEVPSPSSSNNPNWQADVLAYFEASRDVIIAHVLKSATPPTPIGSYAGTLIDDIKLISDVSTPGYRKRSAQGEIINNPFLTVHTKLVGGVSSTAAPAPKVTLEFAHGTQGSVRGRDSGHLNAQGNLIYFDMWKVLVRWKIDWSTDSTIVTPTTVLTYLNSRPISQMSYQNALNTAYGNINAAALDLPTMLVEGKSTIAHLAQTAVRLAQLISNIRRGNFTSLAPKTYQKWKSGGFGTSALKNSPEVTSNAWLEARYAWTPLVLDAVAAASLLEGSSRSQRMTFRGKDSTSSSQDVSYAWTEAGLKFRLTGVETLDQSVRVGHLCESRFDSPLVADLGLTNILGAIKEAIPWSFVVEWFVNLSGFIYRLNPSPAYIIRTSWVTTNSMLEFHGDVVVTAPDGSTQTVPVRYSRAVKDRQPITSPANITLNTRLNVARLIDSMAFLRQIGR